MLVPRSETTSEKPASQTTPTNRGQGKGPLAVNRRPHTDPVHRIRSGPSRGNGRALRRAADDALEDGREQQDPPEESAQERAQAPRSARQALRGDAAAVENRLCALAAVPR